MQNSTFFRIVGWCTAGVLVSAALFILAAIILIAAAPFAALGLWLVRTNPAFV